MFHVSISHLRVGGVSIQYQYQQKEVYPNQVCMGNDCIQVHVCIPCHSYSETYSDPKLCILQTQFKISNLTTLRHLACHYLSIRCLHRIFLIIAHATRQIIANDVEHCRI